MTRVILDYPELRGQIGNMYAVDDAHGPSSKDGQSYYMAAEGTLADGKKQSFITTLYTISRELKVVRIAKEKEGVIPDKQETMIFPVIMNWGMSWQ